jgi:hypothetical protein
MVQALEAVVSQALGFAHSNMGVFWRDQDQGIHLFAAAAFHAMQSTGHARRGGDTLEWLAKCVRSGHLRGAQLVKHATSIVGVAGIQKWLP